MDTTVSQIGEFGLIERIDSLIQKGSPGSRGLLLGIGDDAGAFEVEAGQQVLVTCDSIVEGRHYIPGFTTPFELGRRAMAVNISDIGAMGGVPLYALISLGLRPDTRVADVEDMYRGFMEELRAFGASIIGGNITKVEGAMFIDITLVGSVEADRMVLRSTAKPGDMVVVTGYPGQAAAGLRLLLQGPNQGNLLTEHPLVKAYTLPSQRAPEGQAVARAGLASSMIDISDGLLADLDHICRASGTGAVVELDKIPISQELVEAASKLGLSPVELALGASDDYELIITCRPDDLDSLNAAISEVSDVKVTPIGRITEKGSGLRLLHGNGRVEVVDPKGWDHFKTSSVG